MDRNPADLSGNLRENALANAEIEGVRDRIEIRNQDARAMDFPDGIFDVVVSNLCLHNIPAREGREQACREMVRVLKPGGVAVISDLAAIAEYQRAFVAAGCQVDAPRRICCFPPVRAVRARKPSD
jgi:ubiquinone/menaquinone biosynthesis C-methylase UbiE